MILREAVKEVIKHADKRRRSCFDEHPWASGALFDVREQLADALTASEELHEAVEQLFKLNILDTHDTTGTVCYDSCCAEKRAAIANVRAALGTEQD